MLDPLGSSASHTQNGTDYIITRQMLLSGFDFYIGEEMGKETGNKANALENPELNPLQHADLAGLPPTLIITAEYDPLRDEGELLYRRLLAQGVEAHCERYLGVIHGFFQLSGVSGSARRCIRNIALEINS